jgi:cytochrome oxidase Cu insertion factor (SCO1/SenC/PrrC family)
MQRRLLILAIVFFSMLLLLSNARVSNAQFSEAGVQKLRVAVEAPDFTLKEIGGGKVSLKELRGKIILLNFFATW